MTILYLLSSQKGKQAWIHLLILLYRGYTGTSDGLSFFQGIVASRECNDNDHVIDAFIVVLSNRKSLQNIVSCCYSLGKHHWQLKHMSSCLQRQTSESNGTELRSSKLSHVRPSRRSNYDFPNFELLQHRQRTSHMQSYGQNIWLFIVRQHVALIFLEHGQICSHILPSALPILGDNKASSRYFVNNLDYSVIFYSYTPCGDDGSSRIFKFLWMH